MVCFYSGLIYTAPSGVHKELIKPEDIFVCDAKGEVIQAPGRNLKLSQCAPLFMVAHNLRNAGWFEAVD